MWLSSFPLEPSFYSKLEATAATMKSRDWQDLLPAVSPGAGPAGPSSASVASLPQELQQQVRPFEALNVTISAEALWAWRTQIPARGHYVRLVSLIIVVLFDEDFAHTLIWHNAWLLLIWSKDSVEFGSWGKLQREHQAILEAPFGIIPPGQALEPPTESDRICAEKKTYTYTSISYWIYRSEPPLIIYSEFCYIQK